MIIPTPSGDLRDGASKGTVKQVAADNYSPSLRGWVLNAPSCRPISWIVLPEVRRYPSCIGLHSAPAWSRVTSASLSAKQRKHLREGTEPQTPLLSFTSSGRSNHYGGNSLQKICCGPVVWVTGSLRAWWKNSSCLKLALLEESSGWRHLSTVKAHELVEIHPAICSHHTPWSRISISH